MCEAKVLAAGIGRRDNGPSPAAHAVNLSPYRRIQMAVARRIAGIDWLVRLAGAACLGIGGRLFHGIGFGTFVGHAASRAWASLACP